MAIERTLSIIKPDATRQEGRHRQAIIARFESEGLRIAGGPQGPPLAPRGPGLLRRSQRARLLRRAHRVHVRAAPAWSSSFEGENAIAKNREIMGATNPANAAPKAPSASSTPTASARTPCTAPTPPTTPKIEIAYFFRETELF
jgi:nucleoside-diphosphate kinase